MSHPKSLSTHDIIRWLIYGLVILVPTVYHTGFDAVFTTPKLTVMRIITILIVLVWGVQVLAQKRLSYRSSPLNKWIVGYGVVLGAVTLFSSYFWVSFFGDQGRFLGLMTMLNLLFLLVVVMNFFQTKDNIHRFIQVSVWTAVALSIYGLLQFNGWVGAENWNQDPTSRVFGTMGHSNHFGAYLAFHMMLLVGLFFTARRPLTKGIYFLAMLPMLATILATASRGAFFALVFAGAVFGAALLYSRKQWIWEKRKKIATVLVTILILLAIFHQPLINRFKNLSLTQRTVSTIEFMMQGNVPDRVSWWFSSLAMMRDHPVFGHGLSTYRDVYNTYRRTDYRVPGDIQDTVTPESAHMEYLNIAATQGLVGLIVYLGLILCWARLVFRVMKHHRDSYTKKVAALAMLTAGLVYFVQVLMSFGVVGTLVPLYLLMGASAAYYHITSDETPQSKQFKSIKLSGLGAIVSIFIVLVGIFFSTWFTVRQARAEWLLKTATTLKNEGEVGLMIEAYQKSTQNMPWMNEYWVEYGEGAFQFATYDNDIDIVNYLAETSIRAYERAYALVQTQPYIQANLGLAYIAYAQVVEAYGRTSEAVEWNNKGEEMYREAVTIGVNNPLYAYNLGTLMAGFDKWEEARDAFLHILTFRDPYEDVYLQLATAYTELGDYDNARAYVQSALTEDSSNPDVKALLERINAETSEEEGLS